MYTQTHKHTHTHSHTHLLNRGSRLVVEAKPRHTHTHTPSHTHKIYIHTYIHTNTHTYLPIRRSRLVVGTKTCRRAHVFDHCLQRRLQYKYFYNRQIFVPGAFDHCLQRRLHIGKYCYIYTYIHTQSPTRFTIQTFLKQTNVFTHQHSEPYAMYYINIFTHPTLRALRDILVHVLYIKSLRRGLLRCF
jgi:hypothetical protein